MIWSLIASILSWAAAILMLTGRGSFLIAGYNTSGKEGKELAKREYDIPGITRYLGKMIMLPLAIIFTLVFLISFFGLINPNAMNSIISQGMSILISLIIVFGMFGYIMFVLTQITSGKFKRK